MVVKSYHQRNLICDVKAAVAAYTSNPREQARIARNAKAVALGNNTFPITVEETVNYYRLGSGHVPIVDVSKKSVPIEVQIYDNHIELKRR